MWQSRSAAARAQAFNPYPREVTLLVLVRLQQSIRSERFNGDMSSPAKIQRPSDEISGIIRGCAKVCIT